jgi:tryptophan synthase beta chain
VTEQTKFTLTEDRIPTHWVNLLADLPGGPLPPLNPGTMEPAGPDDLTPIFPMALIGQEVSTEPEIEIPEAVRDVYKLWRPTPLYRAHRLERELDTPARIYYKYEGVSPAGSHKPNSAVAQAYANKEAGVERLVTETGAGQWGSALALACSLFGLECVVYMVGASYDQKPYRRAMMESWGASVIRAPSDTTESGRAQAAHTTGSLGIAISEAVEVAAQAAGTNYALGSVLNHVCLHQTVIGQDVSPEPESEHPDEVREAYKLWRPTPMSRARRLEREHGTPAHIYYKYEGVSPAGSHKPNTAVPQAYENARAGVRKLTTETGAGQWG